MNIVIDFINAYKFFWGGEEPYPPPKKKIPPNGRRLSPKFEKSEIGNFRKQNEFYPKIKLGGGYSLKGIGSEQSKITAKPAKYIVPEICDWDTE